MGNDLHNISPDKDVNMENKSHCTHGYAEYSQRWATPVLDRLLIN